MRILRGIFIAATVLAIGVGCAKDRTPEQAANEEELNRLEKLKAAEGEYSGLLINKNKIAFGAVNLVVTAQLSGAVTCGGLSGGSSSGGGMSGGGAAPGSGRAIIVSELHFKDEKTQADLCTTASYFDYDSGVYQADFDVPVTDDTGKVITVRKLSLTGSIGSGHVRGTLRGVGFSSQTATLDLRVKGGTLDELSKMTKPIPGGLPENRIFPYTGEIKWAPQVDPACPNPKKPCSLRDPLNMNAAFIVRNGNERLVNLFLPDNSKTLSVSLRYATGGHIAFPQAQWDMAAHVLSAESIWNSSSTGQVTRHLRCQNFDFIYTKSPFSCLFWTDLTDPAEITLEPVQ